MVLNIDLNYPPPGQDLFSLEAKYGVSFLGFIGDADYSYTNNPVVINRPIQQAGNERVVSDDDLAGLAGPSAKRMRLTGIKRVARSRNSDNEFKYLLVDEMPKEDKEPKAPTFHCSICLSSMHEETSTKCGHIFCKSCLLAAIDAQGKCPTCRRKLKRRDTFRVYLPDFK